jgi:hypothetical protein
LKTEKKNHRAQSQGSRDEQKLFRPSSQQMEKNGNASNLRGARDQVQEVGRD